MSTAPKTVLVTGGTSGIGGGISNALADGGFRVFAASNSEEEIGRFPKREGIFTLLMDVTEQVSVDQALRVIDGELYGLVNCAGIIQRAGAEFEIEKFIRTIDVNLVGTMRVCLAAKPRFCKDEAVIVNTASMLSFFGSAMAPAYSASKGGVAQLTKSLATAWAPDSVRVNAVAPGWIATPLTQPLQGDAAKSEPILQRTPMKRWGTPQDIGGVVRFLMSDEARFMTGAIIPVDGGYSAN